MGADHSVEYGHEGAHGPESDYTGMGSRASKGPTLQDALQMLTDREQNDLSRAFDQLVTTTAGEKKPKSKTGFDEQAMFDMTAFKELTRDTIPSDIIETLFKIMCKCSEKVKEGLADKKALFVIVALLVKGTVADKANLYVLIGSDGLKKISSDQLHHMTCSLISAALHSRHLNPRAAIWGGEDSESNGRLARVFLDDASFQPQLSGGSDQFDSAQLEKWLVNNPTVPHLFDTVFRSCFFSASDLTGDEVDSAAHVAAQAMGQIKGEEEQKSPLLPVILKHHLHGPDANETASQSLLDAASVLFINSHIPKEHCHLWRQLFSSTLHGESFATLMKHATGRGPTVILVEDCDNHVFGGFASVSWEVSSNFLGDERCFLFSVKPTMAIYTPTGYNNHYMYLNQGMQTMPNGLGMGGQYDYFGLFLDHDYGKGHSKAHPLSTTYNSPQLSKQEEFQIKHIEVWAVGLPVEHQAVAKGSVLDTNLEIQALMEMLTGKPVSGLYEPKLSNDDEDDDN